MREALLTIDVQQGFDGHDDHWGGPRNNPAMEENGLKVLEAARAAELQVIHAIHDSLEPDSPLKLNAPGGAFKNGFEPRSTELVFHKNANSAFIGTDLCVKLRAEKIERLVIFGLTTDHCISTTTRMAGNLGFSVRLVGDACATFPKRAVGGGVTGTQAPGVAFDADLIHETALASLHGEFCHVVGTEDVLRSWR